MAIDKYAYLGTAVDYPLVIANGRLAVVTGKPVIENSYIMILTTPVGTRFYRPEFGSRIHELTFETNDEILGRLLRLYVLDALDTWEKRAKVLDVNVVLGVDVALCFIKYRNLASNEINSFVFPYYKTTKIAA